MNNSNQIHVTAKKNQYQMLQKVGVATLAVKNQIPVNIHYLFSTTFGRQYSHIGGFWILISKY